MLTDLTSAALDVVAASLPADQPVYMLNMVRYRDQAIYQGTSTLPPCSGREGYFGRYASAFQKIAAGEDYGLFWGGNVRALLVGADGERWDDILIVRYADLGTLLRILRSEAYRREAEPHRVAALADWKFLVTTQFASRG